MKEGREKRRNQADTGREELAYKVFMKREGEKEGNLPSLFLEFPSILPTMLFPCSMFLHSIALLPYHSCLPCLILTHMIPSLSLHILPALSLHTWYPSLTFLPNSSLISYPSFLMLPYHSFHILLSLAFLILPYPSPLPYTSFLTITYHSFLILTHHS